MKPKLTTDHAAPNSLETMPFGAMYDAVGLLCTRNNGFRVFRPVIDEGKCVKCLLCWTYCPEGCISKDNDTLTVDLDFCKGCGICAHECPKKCITMVKENE